MNLLKNFKRILLSSAAILIYLSINLNIVQAGDNRSDEFIVRIGILSEVKSIDMSVLKGEWKIQDKEGENIETLKEKDKIKIELKDGATLPDLSYRIVLLTTSDIDTAVQKFEAFKKQYGEENLLMIKHGKRIELGDKVLKDNLKWNIAFGKFDKESDAQKSLGSVKGESILKDQSVRGRGKFIIQIESPTAKKIEVEDRLRLIPRETGARIKIKDVEFGKGWQWEGKESRDYEGNLEVYIDKKGKISVTDEITIEKYLCGVVPAEIGDDSHKEALKAQAVCARSETLAKVISEVHPKDNFDLCADVHCQVYSGVGKETSTCNAAIEECAGEILVYEGKIVDAVYSSNCGGHTENTEDVWASDPEPYLRGILDVENPKKNEEFLSLQKDDVLKKWIESPPLDIFCSASQKGMPNWAKPNFRWTKKFSGSELEKLINKKYSVGKIKDIKLGERGVGGRLKEITVIGENKTVTIKKELTIRQAIGNLPSAAFIVKKMDKEGNYISELILQGSGWGHGVGMCQMGTRIRAIKGQNYKEIIKSYFLGSELKNIYTGNF